MKKSTKHLLIAIGVVGAGYALVRATGSKGSLPPKPPTPNPQAGIIVV